MIVSVYTGLARPKLAERNPGAGVMARLIEITRIGCGVLVFVSGLMSLGIFGWEPPIAGPEARPFQLAMHEAGYFMPIMTATFLFVGASFVTNRFAPLSAIVLFPVSLNIILFHVFLGGGQLPVAILLFAINSYMLWYSRSAYRPLLRPRH